MSSLGDMSSADFANFHTCSLKLVLISHNLDSDSLNTLLAMATTTSRKSKGLSGNWQRIVGRNTECILGL